MEERHGRARHVPRSPHLERRLCQLPDRMTRSFATALLALTATAAPLLAQAPPLRPFRLDDERPIPRGVPVRPAEPAATPLPIRRAEPVVRPKTPSANPEPVARPK